MGRIVASALFLWSVAVPARVLGQDPAGPGPVRSQRFTAVAPAPTPYASLPARDSAARCIEEEPCVLATIGGSVAGAVLLAGVGAGIGYLAAQGGCDPMYYTTQSECERDNMIGGAVIGFPLGAPLGAWFGSSRRISLGQALLGSAGAWGLLGGLWLVAALSDGGQGAADFLAVVAPPAIVATSVVFGLRGEPE